MIRFWCYVAALVVFLLATFDVGITIDGRRLVLLPLAFAFLVLAHLAGPGEHPHRRA